MTYISEYLMNYLLELKKKYSISDSDFNELIKRIEEEIDRHVIDERFHCDYVLSLYRIDL